MPVDEQLSMTNVCRLFKRNHIFCKVENNRILFRIHPCTRFEGRSFSFVEFEEGRHKCGCQKIYFGVEQEGFTGDDGLLYYIRESTCTDMAFFAFHFHDLYREIYPFDEYNSWN